MNKEEDKQALSTYSNVVSGKSLEELAKQGFRSNGVIHRFRMKWACGHEGDAVEIMNYKDMHQGCLKACYQCAEEYSIN